jgi:hypothetical protein
MTPYDFCLPVNLVVLELKVGYDMCAFIGIFSSLFWGVTLQGTGRGFKPSAAVFTPYSSKDAPVA